MFLNLKFYILNFVNYYLCGLNVWLFKLRLVILDLF